MGNRLKKTYPRFALKIELNYLPSIAGTYSHFAIQNSKLIFQSKTLREHLKLLYNFVNQRILQRNLG